MDRETMFRLHSLYAPHPGPLARPLSECRELDGHVRNKLPSKGYVFMADLILDPPLMVDMTEREQETLRRWLDTAMHDGKPTNVRASSSTGGRVISIRKKDDESE